MPDKKALSVPDVAKLLNVGNSTVYDLIKREEIQSYTVGRKIRFTEDDVAAYIRNSKKSRSDKSGSTVLDDIHKTDSFIICGQDLILDVLSNYMRQNGVQALRSFIGSYDGLVSLYRKMVNVTATHMWDSDSDTYNVEYVRRLVPGIPAVIVHLTCRMQGFYVQKSNPKEIRGWEDFNRDDIAMINREKGAGSRVLLDENLKLLGIRGSSIKGYEKEISSHLGVASAVGRGEADVAVGIEKIARQVDNVSFIPMKKERYDLVFRKDDINSHKIQTLIKVLHTDIFRSEFSNIGGYDIGEMGKIVAET